MNSWLTILLMKLELLKGWKLIGVIWRMAAGFRPQASSYVVNKLSLLRLAMKDFKKLNLWVEEGMLDDLHSMISLEKRSISMFIDKLQTGESLQLVA